MKAISITLASTLILSLASCSGPKSGLVPDMPYRSGANTSPAPAPAATASNGEPSTISDAQLLPPLTPQPAPVATPAPAPTPAPSTTPSYGSALIPSAPAAAPKAPTVTSTGYAPLPQTPSAPVAAPAPQPTSSTPVATRVAGDPHRVYNPWNPNQRIRITNPKTGLPFPSGKILGIPGSDKKFIVP